MSLRRVDTHVFSTTLELTGKTLELTGIAVTERSRSAHCDDLTMSFGIRHVFSTTLELTGETLELTGGTLELTGGTLELT